MHWTYRVPPGYVGSRILVLALWASLLIGPFLRSFLTGSAGSAAVLGCFLAVVAIPPAFFFGHRMLRFAYEVRLDDTGAIVAKSMFGCRSAEAREVVRIERPRGSQGRISLVLESDKGVIVLGGGMGDIEDLVGRIKMANPSVLVAQADCVKRAERLPEGGARPQLSSSLQGIGEDLQDAIVGPPLHYVLSIMGILTIGALLFVLGILIYRLAV